VISLHAWPGGLAVAVQGPAHRAVAIFGPDGWRRSEPKLVFPDGPPPGTESVTLAVPEWLADQLASLEMSLGGVHTDFIRLDRLLSRLHRQSASAVVLVLGSRPAVVVLVDGRMQVLEPAVPAGVAGMPSLAGATGWIAVFAGRVVVPAAGQPAPAKPAEKPIASAVVAEPAVVAEQEQIAEPELVAEPVHAAEPAAVAESAPQPVLAAEPVREPTRAAEPAPEPVRAAAPSRGSPSVEERFVVSSDIAAAIPDDVAAEISAVAGAGALSVAPRCDGSQTVAEIAASTGLTRDQVSAVVRLLLARKLAFRYVSRVRPATGAKARN
jgi:hypothetical protein